MSALKTAPNFGGKEVEECVLAVGGKSPGVYHYRKGKKRRDYLESCSHEAYVEGAAKRHATAMGLKAYAFDDFGDLYPL